MPGDGIGFPFDTAKEGFAQIWSDSTQERERFDSELGDQTVSTTRPTRNGVGRLTTPKEWGVGGEKPRAAKPEPAVSSLNDDDFNARYEQMQEEYQRRVDAQFPSVDDTDGFEEADDEPQAQGVMQSAYQPIGQPEPEFDEQGRMMADPTIRAMAEQITQGH